MAVCYKRGTPVTPNVNPPQTVSEGRVFFLEKLHAEAGPFLPPASGGGLVRSDNGSKGAGIPPGGPLWSGALVDSLPRMLHAGQIYTHISIDRKIDRDR